MLAHRTMGSMLGYDSFTKSLLHFNGANGVPVFTDEMGKIWSTTFSGGNANISTGSYEFGGSSVVFNGVGCIDTPDSPDFAFGNGDFTIDFWTRRATTGAQIYLFGQTGAAIVLSSASIYAYFQSDNRIFVSVSDGSSFYGISATNAIAETTTWHHIAIVRSGTTLYLFIDGINNGTAATLGSAALNDSPNRFAIGRAGEFTSSPYTGWIDEFRISKGIARWTANFTPPTAEY